MEIVIDWYIVLATLLFAVGLFGVLARRNVLIVLLSIEIMLNATNLLLIAFSRMHSVIDGQIFAIVVMAIAASEVVVGLGIVVAISHLRRDLDTDQLVELGGER